MKQLNSHMFEDVYKELNINLDLIMLDLKPLSNMYTIDQLHEYLMNVDDSIDDTKADQ